jgi:glycosidase
LYDTLKAIIKGEQSTAAIERNRKEVDDIASHMLHFLENHDEQRIASPEFAGNPFKALPAMVVSTTLSSAPTLLYFGQEVGEDGSEDAGFGQPSRTSIFDYVGVPAHQRYMNKGKFDGAKSTRDELKLRGIYAKLLNLSHQAPALLGEYVPLDKLNRGQIGSGYDEQTFAFARYSQQQKLIVVSNFSSDAAKTFNLVLPSALIDKWQLKEGLYPMTNRLTDGVIQSRLIIEQVGATIALELAPLESMILEVESQ